MNTKYLIATIREIVDETLRGENKIIYSKQVTRGKLNAVDSIPKEEEKAS